MPWPRLASSSRTAIMIPQGLAAQPSPSRMTLISSELTDELVEPSTRAYSRRCRVGSVPDARIASTPPRRDLCPDRGVRARDVADSIEIRDGASEDDGGGELLSASRSS